MPRGDVSSFFFDDVVREDFFLECVNSYFIRFLYLHHTPQYTIIVDKTIVSPPSVEYVNDFLVFLLFYFPYYIQYVFIIGPNRSNIIRILCLERMYVLGTYLLVVSL